MEQKSKRIVLAFFNLIAFLATVAVNGMANALPINGVTTGELSDSYPNLFVPSGFTFSIWGVIYILLGMFAVYQLIMALRKIEQQESFIDRIGPFFIITSAANIGWIFAWHYRLAFVSLLVMLVLFASLLTLYLKLDIRQRGISGQNKIFVAVPFSVYLGWITVATIANVTAVLVDVGWNGFGISETVWTIAVLIVGAAIGLAVLFTRQDIYYALVIEWAYFGILMKRLNVDSEPRTGLLITVAVCMGIILFDMIYQLIGKKVY